MYSKMHYVRPIIVYEEKSDWADILQKILVGNLRVQLNMVRVWSFLLSYLSKIT